MSLPLSRTTWLARALLAADAPGAQLVIDMGSEEHRFGYYPWRATQVDSRYPHWPEAVVRCCSRNLSVDEKQASQFVT